jgi:hypothetical protein
MFIISIIDRNFYKGNQADWQYNNFKFEIKDDNSIVFYVIDNEKIIKKYFGEISTVKPFQSERLVIQMQYPTHHILSSNPTIYRYQNKFHLVFNSPKFKNVFFKKGCWKPIK